MATPFRLARVLRLRETQRRARQHELGELAARRAAVEREWRRARGERDRILEEEAHAAETMVLDAAFLRLSRQFEAALAASEDNLAEAAREIDRRIVAKRDELLAGRREERKMLALEARHRERAALAEARALEHHLDDLALASHRRASLEERKGDTAHTR